MAEAKNNSSFLEQLQGFDVSDIDWENMGSWPIVGKLAFCVLIVAGVLAGCYFGLVESEIAQLERLERTEKDLKAGLESKAFRVANLDEYRAQLVEMELSFGSLLKQLPRDTEVPGLLDDISSAALNSGLDLNKIDPKALQSTEFYNELPIDIEVAGDYHELGAFVSGVASLPRIVTLHDFSITKGKNSSELVMGIQAKTYRYNAGKGGK